jgi:hypothetical protein
MGKKETTVRFNRTPKICEWSPADDRPLHNRWLRRIEDDWQDSSEHVCTGNGSETETYTDKETAYEIRQALRERFENINTMGLTELVAKFYDVVKVKGSECPDEWFSDMLYLNDQIVRANGTRS